MTVLPDVAVQVAFGSTWRSPIASMVWTDLTPDIQWGSGVTYGRGRSSEFDRFTPGKAGFTLDDDDRKYDVDNAAGPYFGLLLPGVPLRILTVGTDYYTDVYTDVYDGSPAVGLWFGFVDDWPLSVPNEVWSEVQIAATDALGMFSRTSLPTSWYAMTVLGDAPKAFWRLDAAADGDAMVDASGNGADGVMQNASFGLESLVHDQSDKAVSISHTVDGRGEYHDIAGRLPTGPPMGIEFWMQGGQSSGDRDVAFKINRDSANASGLEAYIEFPTDSPNGELVIKFGGLGGLWRLRGSTRLDDLVTHSVLFSFASTSNVKVYVDGQLETLTVLSGTSGGTWPGHLWWEIANVITQGNGDFGFNKTIDEFAVYDYAPSAAQALEHWTIGSSGGSTSPVARINSLLDYIGWPAASRDLASDVLFGTGDYDLGGTGQDQLQRIDLSEQGRQFINREGVFVQRPRYWFLNNAAAPVLTLSDDGDGCIFSDPQFGAPRSFLKNSVTGARSGGPTITVKDQPSVAAYGEANLSLDGMFAASDTQIRSLFEYIVARYKDPKTRVTSVTIDLNENPEWIPVILALDCDQQVVVEITPADVGDQSVYAVAIDGVQGSRTALEWTVALQLSPVDTTTNFALWGPGLWGTALWA